MKKSEELVVITKTSKLILWSCNHTSRFPRQHRFVLGERLERTLYDLLEMLIQATYSRERKPLLEQANLKLEILRFQFRLAHDLQCLRTNSYSFESRAINEIGKMLCVGGIVPTDGAASCPEILPRGKILPANQNSQFSLSHAASAFNAPLRRSNGPRRGP